MLATMSEIHSRVAIPALNWSEEAVSGLVPTGTVTLLLADAEGSTRLWETAPAEMTAAFAKLDHVLVDLVSIHHGVRPVEQGEGDSFVLAFPRASDAVACALALQRAPLAPIRLRIGVHTGEVRLRDEGNYIGPAINRTARLRELAHGGQTVLSGTTSDLVADLLPDGAWLSDLGVHRLRDLPRPERVEQLCHPDLRNEFPPLRVRDVPATQRFPTTLTSFVGRVDETNQIAQSLRVNRLVTLTGAGGVGKTRLALRIAEDLAAQFSEGAWYVDLAPITDPDLVPVTMARALGLPDLPGRSTLDALLGFIRDRHILVVLDNCEHLLDASAALVVAILGAASRLKVLATSREPLGVPGEATWRVPSLSLTDEAIELFTDRARLAVPDFTISDSYTATVAEICRRLDGMPLAIELAAARVRALSLDEILTGLHDRFRLLTGGSRTAVRRQQTLQASVEWSHALLTETERTLFRQLAVFLGGFDLDAAQAVAGAGGVERYQVLDQLSLLVDKSLVVSETSGGATRYRLLETMRQFAQEQLGESGEAENARNHHRDHYAAMAHRLDRLVRSGDGRILERAEREIDNLRAAFEWSRENSDVETALALASWLQPLWLTCGRLREGLAWLDAGLADHTENPSQVAPAVYARALADRAWLDASVIATGNRAQAEAALTIARELDDSALLVRALVACGAINGYNVTFAAAYFTEALERARAIGDGWTMSLILAWKAIGAIVAGRPTEARMAAEEGCRLADPIGDQFTSRLCRWCLGSVHMMCGNLGEAERQLNDLVVDSELSHDLLQTVNARRGHSMALTYLGDIEGARAIAVAAIRDAEQLSPWHLGLGYLILGMTALADGDETEATEALEACWTNVSEHAESAAICRAWIALAALARGDLVAAHDWADEAVRTTSGIQKAIALTARARVALEEDGTEQSESDLHAALDEMTAADGYLGLTDIFECLAAVAARGGAYAESARMLGAADSLRRRSGEARLRIHQSGYDKVVSDVRTTLDDNDFRSLWDEGVALSTDDAIAYAQRGRGARKRPATGWEALTPTERDVARLVSEGLGNKEVGARLFISPHTVQTHLTHIYTKLGVTTRTQLTRQAVSRNDQSEPS
ncbi:MULTISPECIES: LuxR C-terminal-related transcriptional regulator [unclassified Mycolicibacterium]|uniref:helix-turn-helix transcriptional regulator n=1 Tax=unclassified Mycolicibacterium TaxID=2636767 RepID=UPI0012DF07D1|nr:MULTISPECIES: LuxR C-terminal-related transcriptional regulator [unclassified Mycolicibacterium]MUL82204.1 LuxR family transcriptional regulator [Mycolicibacterium sp. CBMA 329]MUL87970.1 LuxR family transcriptional regulator [Mycolicibacterium sp. CBMA 331]MUM02301.1 LuxR family transcriptional regulator [Mycolicibacterium sp. CBMA 334]MUM26387.1 LuxR family transcriptional regulator [Mycolicibacterium sp. CBMA 295]MUM38267.1 LuxR family transcriptional regulator [Mycolicibacterium sp. CBM